jgi:hypothetical protein
LLTLFFISNKHRSADCHLQTSTPRIEELGDIMRATAGISINFEDKNFKLETKVIE